MMRLAKRLSKIILTLGMAAGMTLLTGCDDPQVYGSVGVSSGYGGGYNRYNRGNRYGGYNSGMRTSVSVGGRIY
jgi:hypothetical protein